MDLNHTPYDQTHQGRVESWQREKLGQRYGYDFQGAVERQGVKKASAMMREVVREEAR